MSEIEKILVGSGIVSANKLEHNAQAAEYFGILPGQMLAGSMHVSDQAMLTCSKIASLLTDGALDLSQACELAKLICRQRQPWIIAIERVLGNPVEPVKTKLGELLVASGVLTEMQIAVSLINSQRHSKQLGQTLVQSKLISEDLLNLTLDLQECIRAHGMSFKLALAQLKATMVMDKFPELDSEQYAA